MVLAETLVGVMILILGLSSMLVASIRSALLWSVLAVVLFSVGWSHAFSIPFSSSNGIILPHTGNYVLIGVNFMFGLAAVVQSIYYGFKSLTTALDGGQGLA